MTETGVSIEHCIPSDLLAIETLENGEVLIWLPVLHRHLTANHDLYQSFMAHFSAIVATPLPNHLFGDIYCLQFVHTYTVYPVEVIRAVVAKLLHASARHLILYDPASGIPTTHREQQTYTGVRHLPFRIQAELLVDRQLFAASLLPDSGAGALPRKSKPSDSLADLSAAFLKIQKNDEEDQ